MKRKIFAIPSLFAAGFLPVPSHGMPAPNEISHKDPPLPTLFERFRLQHKYTLAAHRSHSSHSSHSSHRSSSGGSYSPPSTRNFRSTPPSSVLPSVGSNVYQPPSNKTYFPPAPAPTPTPSTTAPSPAPLVTLPGNSDKFKRIVMQLQSALTIYGYYTGPINGQVGPDTKVSISKFQQDWNIKVTGTVTPELLDALKIVAN